MTEPKHNPRACPDQDDRARQEADTRAFVREVRDAGGTSPQRIDFNTFIISLGSSAMFHLGHGTLPDGTAAQRNLEMAHQTIDILAMLQEKTRGNLSSEEGELLCNLLYDLRIRYVQALKEERRQSSDD